MIVAPPFDDGFVNATVNLPALAVTVLTLGAPGADFTRTVDGFEATMLVPSARQDLVVVGHNVSVTRPLAFVLADNFWVQETAWGCRSAALRNAVDNELALLVTAARLILVSEMGSPVPSTAITVTVTGEPGSKYVSVSTIICTTGI